MSLYEADGHLRWGGGPGQEQSVQVHQGELSDSSLISFSIIVSTWKELAHFYI